MTVSIAMSGATRTEFLRRCDSTSPFRRSGNCTNCSDQAMPVSSSVAARLKIRMINGSPLLPTARTNVCASRRRFLIFVVLRGELGHHAHIFERGDIPATDCWSRFRAAGGA